MDEHQDCGAPLAIGAAARHLGTTVEALRYYEAQGLVAPERDAAGRRFFSQREMDALHVVLSLREVGFSIRSVRRLIRQKTDAPPQELVARARLVIAELSEDLARRRAGIDRAEDLLQRWTKELDTTPW